MMELFNTFTYLNSKQFNDVLKLSTHINHEVMRWGGVCCFYAKRHFAAQLHQLNGQYGRGSPIKMLQKYPQKAYSTRADAFRL
jgi:hypothetical protein